MPQYIGVDGCKAGWFCVSFDEEHNWCYHLVPDAQSLAEYICDADSVLIDIPIGLLDTGPEERRCDKEARTLLSPKRSASVFPAPARQTLNARSYEQAQLINRESNARGLSQQSWNIVSKIREIDELLWSKQSLRRVVRECHPELCFWALNAGQAMQFNKKTEHGKLERFSVLDNYFEQCHQLFEQASAEFLRRQLAHDDIIDAMACAVTAKHGYSAYTSVPPEPKVDAIGLHMEIVYWSPG